MPLSSNWFALEIALRASAHLAERRLRSRPVADAPTDLFLCLVDHFEPQNGRVDQATARARMEEWSHKYPQTAGRHQDCLGRPPRHSFFYPWDEFDAWEFERLVRLCSDGWGEVELHLHHKDDTADTLRGKLREALALYRSYGALSHWPDGRPAFGFIHGNWALDNSRSHEQCNWCGVNNEIEVLLQEGCYADFTFPAWRHAAQPRQTNSIYLARDDPRPKSYDRGTPLRAGMALDAGTLRDQLLLIQGPLVPHLERQGRGFRLGVDDGDLAGYRRYAPERLDRWVRAGIQVRGRPDRIFVKLHCHGAADGNRQALLDEDLEALFADAERRYNDGTGFRLHYVTAREMYNVALATAQGVQDLEAARNHVIGPPVAQSSAAAVR